MGLKLPGIVQAFYWRCRRMGRVVDSWEDMDAAIAAEAPKSICIVGNAGYLAELPQRETIDSHDLVLRMNNCRLRGFEQHIGGKTDIYMSNFFHDIDFSNPAISEARYHIASRPNSFRKSRRRTNGSRQINFRYGAHIARGMVLGNIRRSFAPSETQFIEWVDALGSEPTTGFAAIQLALTLPSIERIYVTGFSFFEGKSHYFSDQNIQPFHNIQDERTLLCSQLREEASRGRLTCDPVLSRQVGIKDDDFRIAV